MNPQDQLTYKRIPVRADQILDIVQGRTDHLNFPFTINIYTAYSYTGKASNEIRTNMIGQLLAKKNTEEIFHVFLTPDIEQRNVIKINALENVKHSAKFDKHDLFTNTLITEGDKTVFKRSPKEVLLNQKNCICEHKETQDYSPLSRDRNLGNNEEISIINSLSKDYSLLRSTLLQNLIYVCQENSNQTILGLEAFEYGHVFLPSKSVIPIESEQVGGIFGSVKMKNEWSSSITTLSWFEAKGKLEQLFNKLNLFVYWKKGLPKIYNEILHPYRTSKLYLIPGIPLGVFGQINPILASKLNISAKLYLFEFNLEIIKNDYKYKKLLNYSIYSLYPKVFKDLSFIILKKISFTKIKNLIFSISPKVLISIDLLDEYKGNFIPETMTSLCIQFTFQSNEKTLFTKEVEEIIKKIRFVLIEEFNCIIRS